MTCLTLTNRKIHVDGKDRRDHAVPQISLRLESPGTAGTEDQAALDFGFVVLILNGKRFLCANAIHLIWTANRFQWNGIRISKVSVLELGLHSYSPPNGQHCAHSFSCSIGIQGQAGSECCAFPRASIPLWGMVLAQAMQV